MGLRALLFDLGGTLTTRDVEDRVVDEAALSSLMYYLASKGIEISEEDFLTRYWAHYHMIHDLRERFMIEIPMSIWLGGFVYRSFPKVANEILNTIEATIVNSRVKSAILFTETVSVLEELQSKYLLGVVTNTSSDQVARQILRSLRLNRFFECVITSAEFGVRKPYPGIFLCALRELYAKAEDAMFIGDSLKYDIVGAKMSHIKSCFINHKGVKPPRGSAQPDLIVENLAELPVALESISP